MVEHKHEELLLLQWHRSFTQALMKESVSIRSSQLRNAGPDRRFLHRSFCGSKYIMYLNCIYVLYIKLFEASVFYIPDLRRSVWLEMKCRHSFQ